jgi:hypothetical protein
VDEGVEWCKDKIPRDEFNIYRLSDFFILWIIFTVGLNVAAFAKAFQIILNYRKIKQHQFIFFGIRATANQSISKGMRKTLYVWGDFSSFFMSSWHILRLKKILKRLKRVRAKIGNEKVPAIYSKTLQSYQENQKLKMLDLKATIEEHGLTMEVSFSHSGSYTQKNLIKAKGNFTQPCEDASSKKRIPKELTNPITTTRQAMISEVNEIVISKPPERRPRFSSPYPNVVDIMYKKFLSGTLEYLMSVYEPLYNGEAPKVRGFRLGNGKTFFVGKKLVFSGKSVMSIKTQETIRNQTKKIHKKYFKKAIHFYENKLRLAINNHFQLNESITKRFKSAHPNFKESIREILNANHHFLLIFDRLVENIDK